uniref:Uncharacterized protein n=1 Tax=Arundo donax TaxID=35708 RepID=A0A0A9DXZ2_ARUDO
MATSRLRHCLFEVLANFRRLAFGTSKNQMSPKAKTRSMLPRTFQLLAFKSI